MNLSCCINRELKDAEKNGEVPKNLIIEEENVNLTS